MAAKWFNSLDINSIFDPLIPKINIAKGKKTLFQIEMRLIVWADIILCIYFKVVLFYSPFSNNLETGEIFNDRKCFISAGHFPKKERWNKHLWQAVRKTAFRHDKFKIRLHFLAPKSKRPRRLLLVQRGSFSAIV